MCECLWVCIRVSVCCSYEHLFEWMCVRIFTCTLAVRGYGESSSRLKTRLSCPPLTVAVSFRPSSSSFLFFFFDFHFFSSASKFNVGKLREIFYSFSRSREFCEWKFRTAVLTIVVSERRQFSFFFLLLSAGGSSALRSSRICRGPVHSRVSN